MVRSSILPGMSSPAEVVNVECPSCDETYEAVVRAPIDLTVDDVPIGLCPHCGHEVDVGALFVDSDGIWRSGSD